ncbi:MAG TPA: hypothetical protein EYN41_04540 [Flavobacteriales bacterium]|nr:hypothetical protein [Flavobacteriales bacterium]HIO67583.1 hypothetical protein [Flavobacteriales bacterium]
MILKLFKNQRPASQGLLILVALALWSFAFIKSYDESGVISDSLYQWLIHFIEGIPFIKPGAAVVLIIVQAIMINNIIIENQLISSRTYVPSLIYIVLMSSMPEFLKFSPGLIGNFLFILMLNRLFKTYREEHSNSKIFDAGLYLGLASTVHFSFILMLVFGWLSLAILRSFSWRESLVLAVGALVPYSFIFTYYYAFGDLQNLADHFVLFESIRVYQNISLPVNYSPLLIAFVGLILLASKTVFLEWRISVVRVKKLMSTLTLFAGLVLLFSGLDISFCIALAIPLCVYLSNYFINTQKKLVAEGSFLLLLISIVYLHIVTL